MLAQRAVALLAVLVAATGLCARSVRADELSEQVDYVVAIEQAKGHLMSSREVYRRGQRVRGGVHASHPIHELGYRLWRPVTKVDKALGAQLQAALKDPGHAIETKTPNAEYDTIVERTIALMDRGVARAVPAARQADPRFQAKVVQALLAAIEEEYGEAIAEGRVVLEIEYQDAWGFFQRLRDRAAALRKTVAPTRPEMAATIDREMAVLTKAFPSIDTPPTPVPVDRVVGALNAIATALAPLTK